MPSTSILCSAASVIFFSGGAVFCYLWVLEPMYQFLLGFATDNLESMAGVAIASGDANPLALKPMLTIQDYLSLARRLILAFGVVFELPLVIFFLSLVGAITHRGLLKFNRWWTVISSQMPQSATDRRSSECHSTASPTLL